MVKIRVCDICKKEGVLIESERYCSLKGHSHLRLDVCNRHKDTPPTKMVEYMIYANNILFDLVITPEQIKEQLNNRR